MRTGLHCNTTRDHQKVLDYYRKSGADVIKVMQFDPDLLTQLKAMKVTIIGRVYDDSQGLGNDHVTAFINKVVQFAHDYPQVDYWEGYNEEFQAGAEMEKYSQVEIRRMQALEAVGKKAVIGCFSTGQPELAEWPRFRPALEYARSKGHALGLHEYASPFMQWFAGENQWDFERNAPRRIDDPCLSHQVEGWLTLRYRKAYKLFADWGIGDLGLFITEGGIDDINPRPGPQGKGYKDYSGTEWARIPGIGDYAQQRRWYMEQLSADLYTRGAVDFGWDTQDPAWGSFDLSTDPAMLERIIQLESTLPVGHLAIITPEPQPQPAPPPLQPSSRVKPFIVVDASWTLLDVARQAYPELATDDARLRAAARVLATANGLDGEALLRLGTQAFLPRYLLVPGYMVSRVRPGQPGVAAATDVAGVRGLADENGAGGVSGIADKDAGEEADVVWVFDE